jgi:hypothetical protein
MNPAFRRILFETAETLAIALAGGVTCVFLGLPAGLVSGSVMAVATAALLGRSMRVPLMLARICYVVVGTLLGTVVTPETLRGVITWPASVALLMVASLLTLSARTQASSNTISSGRTRNRRRLKRCVSDKSGPEKDLHRRSVAIRTGLARRLRAKRCSSACRLAQIHSAASARSLNGKLSRCQTSTKASASVSIKPSS